MEESTFYQYILAKGAVDGSPSDKSCFARGDRDSARQPADGGRHRRHRRLGPARTLAERLLFGLLMGRTSRGVVTGAANMLTGAS